jgi:flagellar basal body rod protein FlgC
MSDVFSIGLQGLRASEAQFEASARRMVTRPLDNLPDEMVTQKLAATAFKANLGVLKTADEMTKSLLDILA